MKNCTKCKTDKPLTEFSPRGDNKAKLNAWCKICLNSHNKVRYSKNPERKALFKKHRAIQKANIEQKLFDYLSSHPCVQCGESNILTLQFDHLHSKDFELSKNVMRRGWDSISKEIEKCQILCANCHSIKSAAQSNSWKLKWLAR